MTLSLDQQKSRALALIVEAWEQALGEGVEPELLASAALFAALTDMVDIHGEAAVAEMAAGLADRVRRGEFTLSRPPPP